MNPVTPSTADLFTAAREALAALTVHLGTLDHPDADCAAARVEDAVAELNGAEFWLTGPSA